MPKPRKESTVQFDRDDPLVRLFLGYAHLLARYHRHRVLHLERIGSLLQKRRRVVIVGNHALDVIDPLLFTAALIDCILGGRLELGKPGTYVPSHLGSIRAVPPDG